MNCYCAVVLATLAALMSAFRAHATEVPDLNPMLAGFALPWLPASATRSVDLSAAMGNVSLNQSIQNEHLVLDGEVQEWMLRFLQPLKGAWQMQVTLPWRKVRGGQLDNFIEGWHDAFGLPNGNRADQPRNQLRIQHRASNVIDFERHDPSSHLGDISLSLGRVLRADAHPVSIWLTVKLPTGNATTLTGSGSWDGALTFSAAQQLTPRFITRQQLSYSYLGQGDRLAGQQRHHVIRGGLAGELQLTPRWHAIAQFDAHSAVYDSSLKVLGNALQLSVGPQYRSTRYQTTLLVSEDIAVDTAPDVQFLLRVSRRW